MNGIDGLNRRDLLKVAGAGLGRAQSLRPAPSTRKACARGLRRGAQRQGDERALQVEVHVVALQRPLVGITSASINRSSARPSPAKRPIPRATSCAPSVSRQMPEC